MKVSREVWEIPPCCHWEDLLTWKGIESEYMGNHSECF